MKKKIIFGAGKVGQKVLEMLDREEVECFVDNDPGKWGSSIIGVPIYSPEKLRHVDCEICIAVAQPVVPEICKQLCEMGIHDYLTYHDVLMEKKFPSNAKIVSLKNIYAGKRCFIIGTGPSLRSSDLERLQENGEICFASNKIFKLFDETSWRPDIYCVTDSKIFSFYYDEICNVEAKQVLFRNWFGTEIAENLDERKAQGDNKYLFEVIVKKVLDEQLGELIPFFSTKADQYVAEGMTVTYVMMQWAYYLGFSEVYLLGVDFNYGDLSGLDAGKSDHFCKNYIAEGETVNPPKLDDNYKAYVAAEKFTKTHDFRIFNATRGGKLEVFERVDIENFL